MKDSVALVVNRHASRVTEERIEQIHKILARQLAVTVAISERRGHATEIARQLSTEGIAAIFVYSGDGGFNEVLNGLTRRIPLGLIPGGRTNVLPRALRIANDPLVAASHLTESLQRRKTRRVSLGRVNGRRFGFAAGVGLDAEFVRAWENLGHRSDGRRPGDLAFVLAAANVMRRKGWLAPSVLEVVGHGRAAFALVANGRPQSYLGRVPLYFAPEASLEDGLDLAASSDVTAASLLGVLWRAATRRTAAPNQAALYAHDQHTIRVICDHPSPFYADGEDLGDTTIAQFETEKAAVNILI